MKLFFIILLVSALGANLMLPYVFDSEDSIICMMDIEDDNTDDSETNDVEEELDRDTNTFESYLVLGGKYTYMSISTISFLPEMMQSQSMEIHSPPPELSFLA